MLGPGAGQLSVSYRLDTDPLSAAYPITVDFCREPLGEVWLGAQTFSASDFGLPAVSAVLPLHFLLPKLALGDAIIATATDAHGNTSEFSQTAVTIDAASGPVAGLFMARHPRNAPLEPARPVASRNRVGRANAGAGPDGGDESLQLEARAHRRLGTRGLRAAASHHGEEGPSLTASRASSTTEYEQADARGDNEGPDEMPTHEKETTVE